jgi:hypothetical protein
MLTTSYHFDVNIDLEFLNLLYVSKYYLLISYIPVLSFDGPSLLQGFMVAHVSNSYCNNTNNNINIK